MKKIYKLLITGTAIAAGVVLFARNSRSDYVPAVAGDTRYQRLDGTFTIAITEGGITLYNDSGSNYFIDGVAIRPNESFVATKSIENIRKFRFYENLSNYFKVVKTVVVEIVYSSELDKPIVEKFLAEGENAEAAALLDSKFLPTVTGTKQGMYAVKMNGTTPH